MSESEILDALYQGVLDPDALRDAMFRSRAVLRASGCSLHFVRKSNLETLFFTGIGEGYSEEAISAYLDHWQYVNAHRDAMRRAWRPDGDPVFLCHEHFSEEDWEAGAYFQEFYKKNGQRWLAGGIAWSGAETEVSMTFSRPPETGAFGEEDRRFLSMLLPHVRRASKLALRFAVPEDGAVRAGLNGGLASTRTPSFLVDGAARVQWMNAAGEAFVADGRALTVKAGRLCVLAGSENRQLEKLAAEAVNKSVAKTPPGILRIADMTGVIELEILPATVPAGALIGASALALVMVRAIGLDPAICNNLKVRFSLTDAECRLALSLADGASLEETASEGGVSQHTVRAQLRSIFAKTGVNRQSALAALIWKSA